MAEKRPRPFKVLVVGGGIAGLTMSHCLSRAKIDHVVLEAYPEVASPVGASIGFWAHGMRILSQIGCAEEILDRSARLQYSYNRLPNGKPMSASRLFDLVEER
jgi:2-polyprenyl-6-methoxyphenol hydroxylase-like FAD-dependent oxidoreductase